MKSEIQMFVLWPKALKKEQKILDDIASRAEIIASYRAKWPDGVTAERGYRRFYGALLPDSAGKAKRAGVGEFRVVIVRTSATRHGYQMTQRGHEFLNLDLYEMKWHYRQWVGGLHRVHGTLSIPEARHDLMMLTGFTLDEWANGTASAQAAKVLPGHGGWRDVSEMLKLLNETCPYVVMRNAESLPDDFNPLHDDIDMLVASAKECATIIGAVKRPGSGAAAYSVKIGGKDVKLDLREIGDGYFDTAWQRSMLANRRCNAKGVFVPAAEDEFYALVYHVMYMKPLIKSDYCAKLPAMAASAGIAGACSPGDWATALENFMKQRDYTIPVPRDRSVHINEFRANWRNYAAEAEALFGLEDVRLEVGVTGAAMLSAKLDGEDVVVEHFEGAQWRARCGFDLQERFCEMATEFTSRPIRWHDGARGVYYIAARPRGVSLREAVYTGNLPAGDAMKRLAENALRLADALDAADIVHRAISPDALYIDAEGGISLGAFGCGVRRK